MNQITIDRHKLRDLIRRHDSSCHIELLWRSIDVMSDEQIAVVVDGFIRVADLHADESTTPSALDQVRRFHDDSCKRMYFRPFLIAGGAPDRRGGAWMGHAELRSAA